MKEGPIFLVAIVNKQERQIPLSFRQARANVMIEFVWLFVDLPDIFLADPNVARFVRFSIRRFISELRVAEKCDLSLVRIWLRTSFEQELGSRLGRRYCLTCDKILRILREICLLAP